MKTSSHKTLQPQPTNRMGPFSRFLGLHLHNPLRRLILFGQIFGVAPINILPHDGGHSSGRRTLRMAFHLTWSCFLLALQIWCDYEQNQVFVQYNVPLVRFLTYAEYVLNVFNCMSVVFGANYQRRKYHEYLREIDALDNCLNRPSTPDTCLPQFLQRFYGTVLVLVGLQLVVSVSLNRNVQGMLFAAASYILPNVMLMLVLGQYLSMLSIVRRRFEWTLQGLCELGSDSDESLAKHDTSDMKNIFVVESGAISRPVNVCGRVAELRDIYHDLCRLAVNVNNAFGWLLIGVLVSAVFIITGQLYRLYLYQFEKVYYVMAIMYAIGWIVTNFFKVAVLFYMNGRLTEAVRNLNTYINLPTV